MNFKRYKRNLVVTNNKVYSYDTFVAEIDIINKLVIFNNYYSRATARHIAYTARELEFKVTSKIDFNKQYNNDTITSSSR